MVRIKSNGIIPVGNTDVETKALGDNFRDHGGYLEGMIFEIKRSYIYTYAVRLFSSSPDSEYWLAQLNAILDGVSMPEMGLGDYIGLSNKYNDKVDALYNEAINNIIALVQQFKQYSLSLPTTQVSQLQQAGINAAVTGQGVSSSQLSERNTANQSYTMPSENGIETLGNLVGFALNTTSGVLSVMQHFQQIKQFDKSYGLSVRAQELAERSQTYNEQKSFVEFVKLMADQGVHIHSTSFGELLDPDKTPDPEWSNSATTRTKALINEYNEVMAARKYGPSVAAAIKSDTYVSDSLSNAIGRDLDITTGGEDSGALILHDWKDLGDMQLELSLLEAERSAQLGKLDIAEGNTAEDLERTARKTTIADSLYKAKKAEIFLKRLNKLVERRDKGDAVAAIELLNLMNDASWQESAVYLISELGYDLANLLEPGAHAKVRDQLKSDIVDMYKQLKEDK